VAAADAGTPSTFWSSPTALTDGQSLGGAHNSQAGAASNLTWVSGGTQPYIELDLGTVVDIDSIVLYGRNDAYWAQQRNLRVLVDQTPLTGGYATSTSTSWHADIVGQASWSSAPVLGNLLPQADTLDGGAGIDTVDYGTSMVGDRAALGRGVNVNLAAGTADKWTSGTASGIIDTLIGIENATGTAQNDTLAGDANANVLAGGAGNDLLMGRGGNDTLDGGAGQDTADFSGAPLDANSGIQVLMWQGLVNTGHNANGVNQPNMFDTLVSIENAMGTAQNDTLAGNAGANVLNGGAGSDAYLLHTGSGSGADTIVDSGGIADLLSVDAGSQQLWFRHVGNDLVVNALGTADSFTVKDWYGGSANQIETLRAGDGKALLNTQVDALVNAMAGYAMPTGGLVSSLPSYSTNLAPAMAGWH
jgi:Ca2+-binding RTX toxin-like protein